MKLIIATGNDALGKAVRDHCAENQTITSILSIIPHPSGDKPVTKIRELVCPTMSMTPGIKTQTQNFSAQGLVWTKEEVGEGLTLLAIQHAAYNLSNHRPAGYTDPFMMVVYNAEGTGVINDKIKKHNAVCRDKFQAWSVQPGKIAGDRSALGSVGSMLSSTFGISTQSGSTSPPNDHNLTRAEVARVIVDIVIKGAQSWAGDSHIIDGKQIKSRASAIAQ